MGSAWSNNNRTDGNPSLHALQLKLRAAPGLAEQSLEQAIEQAMPRAASAIKSLAACRESAPGPGDHVELALR